MVFQEHGYRRLQKPYQALSLKSTLLIIEWAYPWPLHLTPLNLQHRKKRQKFVLLLARWKCKVPSHCQQTSTTYSTILLLLPASRTYILNVGPRPPGSTVGMGPTYLASVDFKNLARVHQTGYSPPFPSREMFSGRRHARVYGYLAMVTE